MFFYSINIVFGFVDFLRSTTRRILGTTFPFLHPCVPRVVRLPFDGLITPQKDLDLNSPHIGCLEVYVPLQFVSFRTTEVIGKTLKDYE